MSLEQTLTTQSHWLNSFHVWEICPKDWHSSKNKRCIFFSHAAGVASGTYLNFLKDWALSSGSRIFAMDCRGIGQSSALKTFESIQKHKVTDLSITHKIKDSLFGDVVTPLLQSDLMNTFACVKDLVSNQCIELQRNAEELGLSCHQTIDAVKWTLAGHSLGGWLSLLVAHKCFVTDLVLFDISILPKHVSFIWTLACLTRQRKVHTLAKVAKARKICYRNEAEAKRVFRRSPMFRGWKTEDLDLYLGSNYKTTEKGFELRHDPLWEATLLESQQPSASAGFAEIPKHLRSQLNVLFVAGELSEACTLEGARVVKSNFENAKWVVLPGAKHMFPFTHGQTLLRLLEQFNKPPTEFNPESVSTEPSLKLQGLSKKRENFRRTNVKVA